MFQFMESFDHYGSSLTDMDGKWPSPGGWSGTQQVGGSTGRRGTGSNNLQTVATRSKYIPSPGDATVVVGWACKLSAATYIDVLQIWEWVSGTFTQHLNLAITAAGGLELRRGGPGGTLLGSAPNGTFNYLDGFHYVELKATIHDTTGAAEVRINGSAVIGPLTGIDTRNGGTLAGWNYVRWNGASNPNQTIDDVYILDGSGSSLNTFLGDVRVDTHFPNANGNSSGSTPSTGTDRYATVDEADPNDDTDYNTITSVGTKDTLGIENLKNSGATPLAVQVSVFCRKTDDGTGRLCPVMRQDSTDYDGASANAGVNYEYFAVEKYPTAPDTTAWTEAKFNAIEVGYKRTA